MLVYTCHDAILLLKRKSFVKYLKNCEEDVSVYPLNTLDQFGIFYIEIKDSDTFVDSIFKVVCKDSAIYDVSKEAFDKFMSTIKDEENYPVYHMQIKKKEEVQKSIAFDEVDDDDDDNEEFIL